MKRISLALYIAGIYLTNILAGTYAVIRYFVLEAFFFLFTPFFKKRIVPPNKNFVAFHRSTSGLTADKLTAGSNYPPIKYCRYTAFDMGKLKETRKIRVGSFVYVDIEIDFEITNIGELNGQTFQGMEALKDHLTFICRHVLTDYIYDCTKKYSICKDGRCKNDPAPQDVMDALTANKDAYISDISQCMNGEGIKIHSFDYRIHSKPEDFTDLTIGPAKKWKKAKSI